jgi:hypothetical protein
MPQHTEIKLCTVLYTDVAPGARAGLEPAPTGLNPGPSMSVGADVPIRPLRPSRFAGAHLRVRPERHDTHRGRPDGGIRPYTRIRPCLSYPRQGSSVFVGPDALIGPKRSTLYSVMKTNKSSEMRNLISVTAAHGNQVLDNE